VMGWEWEWGFGLIWSRGRTWVLRELYEGLEGQELVEQDLCDYTKSRWCKSLWN
jgi:hypothetical protein